MHIDDDRLVHGALQSPTSHEASHLRDCADCRRAARDLSHARETLKMAGPMTEMPPDRVWDQILEQTVGRSDAKDRPAGPKDDDAHLATVTSLGASPGKPESKSAVTLGWLAAAAGVGAVVALAGSALLNQQPEESLVATAELDVLSGAAEPAQAEILMIDGQQVLRIDQASVSDLEGQYLEVWLLNPDSSGLITLGLLDGESGDFALPENLSTAEFSVVDVSVEAYDGDPSHSGDSVWRGPLKSS
ncbi:anti-sigma factor [Ornithinimicrobium sp. Arc0846-15]|nr:anti-sigma factor [Ornithinimicrobium laminariae]